jgi:hypothetical protein
MQETSTSAAVSITSRTKVIDRRESGRHGQESETRRVLFNGTGEFMTFVSNSAGESGTATDCCPRQCRAQERRFIANCQDRL